MFMSKITMSSKAVQSNRNIMRKVTSADARFVRYSPH